MNNTMFPSVRQHPIAATLGALTLLGLIALEVASASVKVREYRILRPPPADRTITVTGTHTVRAAPDIARVSAGVTITAKQASEAQRQANQRMAVVLQAVAEAGIPAKDVQTSNYSVYPQYDYTSERGQTLIGYQANQSITITIRDLDRIHAVFDALRNADATDVGSLQFAIDDPERLRAHARAEAIAKARREAESTAQALGVRLGIPVLFSEFDSGFPIPYARALEVGGGGDAAPAIQAGENEITVTVTVTYQME